ncbi:MAG: hypothetical protein GY745_15730 [Actinomycetia bacterium]|nr:hypothetical protein [Actinomycetes bacterium]MCP3913523.1 hypothetical protein [Actinomycetes bacterium]MCP4086485.1 hypothetical protein [Actinomycetes bacterium]
MGDDLVVIASTGAVWQGPGAFITVLRALRPDPQRLAASVDPSVRVCEVPQARGADTA